MARCDLNYAHAPVWCDACWEDARQARTETIQRETLVELKTRNELLEEELDLAYRDLRKPRREAPPPPPMRYPKKPAAKGGMSVQPRRTDHQG
jgi:hypothetical protein